MNKIEEAIYSIHYMDNQVNQDKFINKIHPLVKLLITIFYIVMLTSIDKYNLNTCLAMGIYLIIISIIGDLSIKNSIKRLKDILILLIVIGIANPILDRDIITYIGIIPIWSGVISMITLILKGLFSLISSYFLISTTSIESICYGFKLLHIPNILITIIMLIYRYIIVFLKEFGRIWTAYSLRAPKQKGFNFKVWGSMLGSLIIRSIDKANTVYESMELRGFNSDTFFIKEYKMDKTSVIAFFISIVFIIVVRFVPVFEFIGNIFIL